MAVGLFWLQQTNGQFIERWYARVWLLVVCRLWFNNDMGICKLKYMKEEIKKDSRNSSVDWMWSLHYCAFDYRESAGNCFRFGKFGRGWSVLECRARNHRSRTVCLGRLFCRFSRKWRVDNCNWECAMIFVRLLLGLTLFLFWMSWGDNRCCPNSSHAVWQIELTVELT